MSAALVAMRDRYVEEHRRQQSQTCDSGMGTSVGDSESEAESLTEHVAPRNPEENPPAENGEKNRHDYAAQREDESEDSSSSSEESEEDNFMRDRQTDEDYSAYRERIFDFTPKGYRQKKSLVEEITEEDTSAKETPGTASEDTTPKQNARQGEAFNFQQMVQHMSRAEGMVVANKDLRGGKSAESVQEQNEDNTGDYEGRSNQQDRPAEEDQEETRRQQTLPTNEDDVSEAKSYMDRQRRILVDEATERVKKSDMSTSSLTFEEYVTSLDRPANVSGSETSGSMTKNIARDNVSGGDSVGGKPKKNLTLKDIMKDTNVINAESDSDDSDSSEGEDEDAVTGKGDGHPVCRLRNPEEIEEMLKGILTTSSKRIEEEETKVCEDEEKSVVHSKPDTVEDTAMVKGYEETSVEVPIQPESENRNDDETEDDKDTNVNQVVDTRDRSSEESAEIFNDIPTKLESNNETVDIKCNSGGESFEIFSDEPTKSGSAEDEPENEDLTETSRTTNVNEDTNSSSEDDSSDDQEKPYYRKLDKCEATILKQTDGDTDAPSTAKSKEEIKEELGGEPPVEQREPEDSSYREMLEWNLKVSDRNVQILPPTDRKQSNEEFRSELCEMLAQTKQQDKPEFEVTPPKDIAEENDKILYARNTKESICCTRYQSVFTQKGKTPDVKPPLVHKVLKLSQNYPVFQKNSEEVVQNEVKEESNNPENALAVSNKISEVREYMAQFTKNLEEFNERSRLAREEVIKDYNSAVERELKIVDKIMSSKQHAFNRRCARPSSDSRRNRRVDHIDDNVLRKHFEDMDMILEEDSSDSEEEFKAAVQQINREVFKDFGQQAGGKGEYVLSKVPAEKESDDEEEKKDEEKGTISVDNESYEEYLTTNEDEGEEDSMEDKIVTVEKGRESNVKEKSCESCEEYSTTNEDQEEYYDASSKDEGANDEGATETGYQRFIDKSEEENCKESAASVLEEKETDDNTTTEAGEKYEQSVIKRNINCSLEMQLAKRTDEEA